MASNNTTSSSADAVPRVILRGFNYAMWRIWMNTKLSREGLWDVVESSTKNQSLQNDDASREKNAAALHTILYWCSPTIWHSISSSNNISSAKDVWDELAKKYGVVPGNDNQSQILDSGSQSSQVNTESERQWHSIEVEPMPSGRVENPSRSDLLTYFKAIYGISGGLADEKKLTDNSFPLIAKPAHYKTVLLAATSVGDTQIVEVLVKYMSAEDLLVTGKRRNTALGYAASHGYTQIAKCLYEKNKNLVTILNGKAVYPVEIACKAGYIDTTRYLYSVTPIGFLLFGNGTHGSQFLSDCIRCNMFDIAFHLFQQYPELAVSGARFYGGSPIVVLSSSPSLFWSGSKLSFWERCIYSCLKVKQSAAPNEDFSYTSGQEKSKGGNIIPKAIKRIYNLKKSHGNALEFLGEVCKYTSTLDYAQLIQGGVHLAVFNAAKHGITEFIIEIFKANPDLISLTDKDGRDIFMIATQHRQEKVFSLIYGFDTKKAAFIAFADKDHNGLLHLAANLNDEAEAKLTQISGAALQMQRELQWFKEIENILPQTHKLYINNDEETAKQVFDRTHKELAKEGQEWMKKTANSSTVLGTLIMTITFAAAFTVPGGYDQNTGFPIFLTSGHDQYYEHLLKIFIIYDVIALITSSTSVLMFLCILTSRYAMEDFLKSLPNKLFIALYTLIISIGMMMVPFCAGLIIMLEGRSWITIPIILFATIPITFFAWLLFPLLVKIFISTYGAEIFDRKMKLWT